MGEGEGADGWGRAASERGSREGESGEVLTGGAQWSGGWERRADWAAWAGREGGCGRARAGLEFGPAEGGERDFLFLFLF